MSFLDFMEKDVENSFDEMYDWDRDGKLNPAEQCDQAEYEVHHTDAIYDEEEAEFDPMDSFEQEVVLSQNGLDMDELEMMDPEERRDALEYAGFDPDDFEDCFDDEQMTEEYIETVVVPDNKMADDTINVETGASSEDYDSAEHYENDSTTDDSVKVIYEDAVSELSVEEKSENLNNQIDYLEEQIKEVRNEKIPKGVKQSVFMPVVISLVSIAVVGFVLYNIWETNNIINADTSQTEEVAADDVTYTPAEVTEEVEETGLSDEEKASYYEKGVKFLEKKKYRKAYKAFIKADDYSDSSKKAEKCVEKLISKMSKTTLYGEWKIEKGYLKKADQSVKYLSSIKNLKYVNGDDKGKQLGVIDSKGRCSLLDTEDLDYDSTYGIEKNKWKKIIYVAPHGDKWINAIAVKKNGSLVYEGGADLRALDYWQDMRMVNVYGRYVAGLNKYGEVKLYDYLKKRECSVNLDDIIYIKMCSYNKLYALSADGTVNIVTIGVYKLEYDTCSIGKVTQFAVFDGGECIVGLKSNGRIVSSVKLPKKIKKLKNISMVGADYSYISVKYKNGKYECFPIVGKKGDYKMGDETQADRAASAVAGYLYIEDTSEDSYYSSSSSSNSSNKDEEEEEDDRSTWDDDLGKYDNPDDFADAHGGSDEAYDYWEDNQIDWEEDEEGDDYY